MLAMLTLHVYGKYMTGGPFLFLQVIHIFIAPGFKLSLKTDQLYSNLLRKDLSVTLKRKSIHYLPASNSTLKSFTQVYLWEGYPLDGLINNTYYCMSFGTRIRAF